MKPGATYLPAASMTRAACASPQRADRDDAAVRARRCRRGTTDCRCRRSTRPLRIEQVERRSRLRAGTRDRDKRDRHQASDQETTHGTHCRTATPVWRPPSPLAKRRRQVFWAV